MKTVKLIFLTVILVFLIAGQRQIKYFLSDRDFLTGKNVPKSEVIRKPHIRAEYDDIDRLIIKSYIDRSGKSIRQEQYSYIDTNTVIRQKDLVDIYFARANVLEENYNFSEASYFLKKANNLNRNIYGSNYSSIRRRIDL